MRTEQHTFAVIRPSIYLVVVSPSRRERPARGIVRQLFRFAARTRHHVHLLVSVVLAGKCKPLAVRRKLCKQFESWVRR